ncbi:TIGR03668 family PPOX class F420-dependent oxidoreductase [Mycobacterium spongiae]|uniref:TIGR03668 family PPOX class F420-dependent oxidoreductase n=1 Tax=Mycobacterium spongiae TaxID=886343 RepID=A0A975JUE0_9MYCO|nr:TIGR03668 family PPOX class F420-dependent oxidoreductase [Mycobacterium spongiae]QUR65874.1 TIGR03668 family PPOX class F420-dependent oxidoreductase [Mycobacterium spongiae]
MGQFDPKAMFNQSPVARLATITPGGKPHLVPVVFAVGDDLGDAAGEAVIYTAVDAKPKTTQRLRRLTNIENNPHVSVLVDHYTDNWTQLWWIRADGLATIYRDGEAARAGYRLLRTKYSQYQSVSLSGPVIAVAVSKWTSWHA